MSGKTEIDNKTKAKSTARHGAGNGASSSSGVLYSVLLTAALVVLIFSASVAVPILWRGFYYRQIEALHLTEYTPWSYAQIREAYDQMMDFCLKGAPFGTGVLKWSEEGMLHFADCRALFMLDLRLLKWSAAATAVLLILRSAGFVREKRFFGRGPFFWAGVLPAAVFALLVVLTFFVDFDTVFVTFHQLFFPGKTNWIFDPATDEIILVLPEVFFMRCAILIVAMIMLLSAVSIAADFLTAPKATQA